MADNFKGQMVVSELTNQGIKELDVSREVMTYMASYFPFQARLVGLGRVRPVSNLVGYRFQVMPELTRTFTVVDYDNTTANALCLDGTDLGLQNGDIVQFKQGTELNGTDYSLVAFKVNSTPVEVGGDTTFLITEIGTALTAQLKADLAAEIGGGATVTIYKTTSASGDGSLSPNMVMPKQLISYNNCQQIKKTVELSNNVINFEKQYITNIQELYSRIAASEFFTDTENSLFFGRGGSTAKDVEGKQVVTTQGFFTALTNKNGDGTNFKFLSGEETGTSDGSSLTGLLADGSDFTYDTLMAWLSDAMVYGSSEKDLYVDSWFMDKISAMNIPSFRTYSNANTTLGMEVTEVLVPGKGRVNLMYNPCFEKGFKFNGAVLVDMNYVNLNPYRAETKESDIQENDRDGKKAQIMATKGIEYGRIECHGYATHL